MLPCGRGLMAKFLLRCAEDVDIFHAAAIIAGSVMRIALEMLLMIRAFDKLMLRGIITWVSSQMPFAPYLLLGCNP